MISFIIERQHHIVVIMLNKSHIDQSLHLELSMDISNNCGIVVPKVIADILIVKLIFKLEIIDFDYRNNTFIFHEKDTQRVIDLFEIYKQIFDHNKQYLLVQYIDEDGHPQNRFELDVSKKKEIIHDAKKNKEPLDLLQVAEHIVIDVISIRRFGLHTEIINRLGP
ncbi:hypothetical protein VCR4J2_20027 [Vibrio coralliirubri]|uniref:hypothetical protein n=1 Tax=Vibrio coralliirubri TaxID=1516159 RepID=UPI000632A903|nr:hypothetical protein [Vibrio coralliirubri]CDT01760.1 hypothetical protein VCR4J2_20027 [Vibrio coralliirubri]